MSSELNELLPALQEGDVSAWDTLYFMYGHYMFCFALKLTRNKEKAVDLSNDAYLAMRRNELKNCNYLTQGYLGTVVYHEYCRVIREKKHRKEISFEDLGGKNDEGKPQPYDPEDPTQTDIDKELDLNEFIEQIRNILASDNKVTLTPEQSEAFIMRYFDELSLDVIADIQDVPKDTVKKRIKTARDKLFLIVKSYKDL